MWQPIRDRSRRATRLLAGFCLLWHAGFAVEAGSLYVYTDAQGQAVLTDNVQQVPAEFRGRLRTVANGEAPADGGMPSAPESAPGRSLPASSTLQEVLHAIAQKVHPIKGLTPHQTAVLIMAGAGWLALLALMFLSSNPAIRILGKCLLVLISLTAAYQLAVGGIPASGAVAGSAPQASGQQMGTIVDQVKTKTEQSYRLQDERTTRQLDQADQTAP